MTKILEYLGQFKSALLLDELVVALPAIVWNGVDARLEENVDGTGVLVTVPDATDEPTIQGIINAHDHTADSIAEAIEAETEEGRTGLADQVDNAISDYELALANWDTLTNVQRDAVLKRHTQVLVKLLKYMRARVKGIVGV